MLKSVVLGFDAQASAPQFQVTTWAVGFHTTPTTMHDENGQTVAATRFLDL